MSAPFVVDGRTRSIWLTQLSLAATVVIISVMLMYVDLVLFARPNVLAGIALITAITTVTMGAPWSRWPKNAVLVIPFLDVVAIGFLASGTDLRFAFLWAFPVMWVGMHFSLLALGGMLALIAALTVVDAFLDTTAATGIRILIVICTLSFVGISSHIAMRQVGAARLVVNRQAERLRRTVVRRSEQERQTAQILDAVDIGVARIAADGRILSVNTAYSRLFGIDVRTPEQPARSVEYAAHGGMPVAPAHRPISRARRGETFSNELVWVFTMSGAWLALSMTAKRLATSEDEDATILLLAQDVTPIAQAQRQRERLTAIASHELRHPLTVLIGQSELGLEDTDLKRSHRRFETILHASERMLEMTQKMLRTSDEESPTQRWSETDLTRILADSVETYGAVGGAKSVRVTLDTHGELRAVVDAQRIRQVVDNLVSNAVKYTLEGGEVHVSGSVEGGDVVITVQDTGIGIASDDLQRVLTPNFRTAAAKATAPGTGLGLGITSDIVAAHGGTLAIDSEPDAGTIVSVRLPRRGPKERPSADTAAVTPGGE